jgi:hypothetical protein
MTQTQWHGSLSFTKPERAALHVDRRVTDALIDDVLPTLEYMAFFGTAAVDATTRPDQEATARGQAAVALAFRALLQERTRVVYVYFIGRWIERGMTREDAERRFAHLIADLEALEAHLHDQADEVKPRRGKKADIDVDFLVRSAAASWHTHTGERPRTSESSGFVKFCVALAKLAELPITRDKIRTALQKGY